jgi:hypothetical protein
MVSKDLRVMTPLRRSFLKREVKWRRRRIGQRKCLQRPRLHLSSRKKGRKKRVNGQLRAVDMGGINLNNAAAVEVVEVAGAIEVKVDAVEVEVDIGALKAEIGQH